MKVVLCHAFGDPDGLRVEEIEPLDLEKGQVRIRVRAAGINFPDYLMVTGKYQVKPPLPFTPGIEAAGEIIECAPDVFDLHPGQRVDRSRATRWRICIGTNSFQRRSSSQFQILWISSRRPGFRWPMAPRILR